MQVHFFATLRQIVGGKTLVLPLPGAMTVRRLLDAVIARYPALYKELFDEQGQLYRHVHVLINGRDVLCLEAGLETPISAEDTVNIFPAVAGGAA
jgi:molybdopterin synthase sulfur carrier subunit